MKNIIGALAVAGAIFLVWGFALPDYQAIGPLKELTVERQAVLTRRQATAMHLEQLARDYQQRQPDFQELSMVIPPKKEIPEMITAIESIAASNGVQLLSVNLSEQESASTPYDLLGINLALSGNYAALLNMLGAVQRSIRLMDVETLSISPQIQEGVIKTLSFSMKGKAYFLSDERISALVKERTSQANQNRSIE